MASIPQLAVPPTQQSPLDQYQKLQSIAALSAERQQQQAMDPGQLEMQRQQIQAAAQENQARTVAAKQTQAMNAAFQGALSQDPTTGAPTFDKGKVLTSIAASGNGSLIPQMTEKFNQIDKTAADLAEAKDKHATATQDYFGALASEVKQAGYSPGALGVALAHATANGYGQQAQQIQQQYAQNPDSIKQWVDQAIAGSPKQREVAAQEMRAAAAKAQSEKQPNETGAAADQDYQALLTKKNIGQPLSAEESASMKAYEQRKTLGPRTTFQLNANGVGGSGSGVSTTDANGNPLSFDDQIKSFGAKGGTVKAIIEGRQDPPSSFAQSKPYWQDVMTKVNAVDPDFNQQRAQLRKAFTVGKQSTEINAINTAMGHVGVLGDAIDALNNGNVPVLNSIANKFGVAVGQTPVTTFNTIVHRVGPELSKAYLGAGGSAGERGADEADFDPSKGVNQLKTNVGITAQLLRSKIGSLENQWDQNKAPSMPSFQEKFISPEATKQLNKYSPQGGGSGSAQSGITVTDPKGTVHTFKDQASADKFKKLANIQ